MFFSLSLGDKCQTAAPGGPSTPPPVGSPPKPDIGQSRGRIVIEPASVPEAATKPALRHAGLCSARLVRGSPFLGNAPRARKVRRTRLFPAFRLASPRPEGQGSALPLERRRRARDSPRRVYRGEPADLRKEADDRSEGLRPPLRAGRTPTLVGSLSGRKGVLKRGSFSRERHSAEHDD